MEDNLIDLLLSGDRLTAGAKVRTTIFNEMEIYGFIPVSSQEAEDTADHSSINLDFKMQDAKIASNRISVSSEITDSKGTHAVREVYPILNSIEKASEGHTRFPLRDLYVPHFRYNIYYKKYIKNIVQDGNYVKNLKSVYISEEKDQRTDKIISVAYYETTGDEFLFYDNCYVRAVGEYFIVICRRTNTVTGNINFELFRPEELRPLPQSVKKECTD